MLNFELQMLFLDFLAMQRAAILTLPLKLPPSGEQKEKKQCL